MGGLGRSARPRRSYHALIVADVPWHIAGTYLEACNCAAICPCRRIDDVPGGRSTEGICMGALSWKIERGNAGAVDLSGLGAVLASRYDDDEPGSPWDFFLYVDERGDDAQRAALSRIFTGRLGGSADDHFPWAWKDSNPLGVRAVAIEIDHVPGRGWFRAGGHVSMRVRAPYAGPEKVTCVIPGHDRSGDEVITDLEVADDGLGFEFEGRCGYESTFEYSSAE
jgi:hypothetical protein